MRQQSMIKKTAIGIDIDGTLTDPTYFIPHLNAHFKREIKKEDAYIYDYTKLYEVTQEEIRNYFKSVNVMFESPLLDYAKETVLELNEKHDVYIITARNKELHDRTRAWLDARGLEKLELLTLGTPAKAPVAKELGITMFLEDHPTASIEIAQEDIQVYLMDAPYNQQTVHKNIQRVYNWMEMRKHLVSQGAL